MASLKRKHDELDESDEDEPAYGKQILPVANLPNDFNEEPVDGLQYLFTVRRDARQRPDVIRAPNPYSQADSLDHEPSEDVDVESLQLPSEEWREQFEYRFLNFRKNIKQPTIHVGPPNHGSRRLMPDKKDRDLWWAFLEGQPESDWTPVAKSNSKFQKPSRPPRGMRAWADDPQPRRNLVSLHDTSLMNDEGEVEQVLRVDPAESLPSPAGTPIPLDYLEGAMQPGSSTSASGYSAVLRLNLQPPREPNTVLLTQIDEKMAFHLLMYFTHWINLYLKAPDVDEHIPKDSHARWIFALLSRVEDNVFADDMNLLRNLARACLGLIEEKFKNENSASKSILRCRMSESSCWLIFTLVADVWKQRDLWQDAEAAMRSCK
ncbi:hypothetical protein CPB83DRAFT_211992 [Crepidotus variabilis]|uniref:Survival motor neuron interacting protein 1-domain-containing protein n=1 Tax=Crepidotus variabilis TaxID=179855 RepID=A0A9P6ETT0_9AGAR|nr:hypothetical protein CPB83DRAFT_211992 [Crepidotus variabilis]